MKTLIPTLALVLAALSTSQAAQPGFLSIQAETVPDVPDYSVNASVATNRIGVRISPSERLGIDVLAGFSYRGGHGADSATNTVEEAGYGQYSVEAGVAWKLSAGERASFSLLGRGAVTYVKTSTSYTFLKSSSYEQKNIAYDQVVPSLFVGVEPSVSLAPNFQLYSSIGLRLAMLPASKYAPNTYSDSEPALLTQKDDVVAFGLSGLSLGMRYVF